MNYIFSWMCMLIHSMFITGTLSQIPHHFSNLKKLLPEKAELIRLIFHITFGSFVSRLLLAQQL